MSDTRTTTCEKHWNSAQKRTISALCAGSVGRILGCQLEARDRR